MSESRDPSVIEPLQRRTYEAAQLVRQHPPVLRHPNKQLLFAIGSPADAVHSGRLEYSRWPEIPLPPPLELDATRLDRLVMVCDGYYDYRPTLDPAGAVEWHVNFADPNVFYAYGWVFFAQDEIQVAEARYVLGVDGLPADVAEFALAVADGWQGVGLGSRLLGALVARARAAGLRKLRGSVMADNVPMLTLAQRLGARLRGDPEEASLMIADFELTRVA